MPLFRPSPAATLVAVVGAGTALGGVAYWRAEARKRHEQFIDDPHALTFVPPTRHDCLQRLQQDRFDLLIIGGGATGAGCALDAASRGLSTACIDAGDWASGTSSKSTKLVHGGVRYLEKAVHSLDLAQFSLVKEALEERRQVLKIAPHLTDILPIMLPVYQWWKVPYYWLGVKVYDLISFQSALAPSHFLSSDRAIRAFPLLKQTGLFGALVYYDGQQDDARMNVSLALTAMRYNAAVCNYVEVVGLVKDEGGRLCGAKVRDKIGGAEFEIRAAGIINATGPFCDEVRRMDDGGCPRMVSASTGVHIVLPEYYSPRDMGLIDPTTSDQRVVFFLPWQHNSVAGTTDVPSSVVSILDEPEARPEDVDYILAELSKYLDGAVRMRRCDVLSTWAGLRPLVRDIEAGKDTASLVRSHSITISKSGLLTITGGKWTTYRRMAEETVDRAIQAFSLQPVHRHTRTRDIRLLGAQRYSDLLYIQLVQQFGYETEVAKHLARSYGDRSIGVAMCELDQQSSRWPLSGTRLVPWYPYIEAEVRWAVRHEFAQTPMDVLCRRTRLAFHNCRAALDALPRVCAIMKEELGWSDADTALHLEKATQQLHKMGLLTLNVSRTESSPEQLKHYKEEFRRLGGPNGYISAEQAARVAPGVLPPDGQFVSLAECLETVHR